MPKLKYNEISSFSFSQAMQKLAGTPTHGQKASQIHKIVKSFHKARAGIIKAYQKEIADVFGKRDDAGKLIRPEGEPAGFEPMEDKLDELKAAQEVFGQQEVEVNCPVVTLDLIADIKVSAQDLEALKGLYAGYEPDQTEVDAPVTDNVAAIR